MNLAALSAIRAIVAVAHPHHHLLTAIDAKMDRLRAEEPNEERGESDRLVQG